MGLSLEYQRLDVFTGEAFGGNPPAVFLDAPDLSSEQMQTIAREMNLSESVFVGRSSEPHAWPVRIFTPGVELPFAGHPTIGAAVSLVLEDRCGDSRQPAFALLEKVGRVEVVVHRRGARRASATFKVPRLPEHGAAELSRELLAELLGVDAEEVLSGDWRPRAVSCGVPFYFIALTTLGAIRRVRLRRDLWETHLASHWAPHLYVITREVEREGSHIHARTFPPAMAVDEDPATGGAAAALAGFVHEAVRPSDGVSAWKIEQGFEMGRPSIIDLEFDVEGGAVCEVRLKGEAVAMGGGTLLL